MSRDGKKHQPPPPPPLSSSAATAVRILPRYPDGKLRYHGGETRVLSVERSISFAELFMKLGGDVWNIISTESEIIRSSCTTAGTAVSQDQSFSVRLLKPPKKSHHHPLLHSPNCLIPLPAMLPPRCPKPIGGGPFFSHVLRPSVYPQPAG
ncbi:PB1 domain-containing protein [Abeliophyllum distichum]|uniref:PB1 domain-containing protein n=1 Tax=Abeliophyllum distichum TaxID=126358 RepID=A0ABD1Q5U0_9LAMI